MERQQRFAELCAQVGEHFPDYLIIARDDNNMFWRGSNDSWGLGAAHRYLSHIQDQDRFQIFKSLNKEDQ